MEDAISSDGKPKDSGAFRGGSITLLHSRPGGPHLQYIRDNHSVDLDKVHVHLPWIGFGIVFAVATLMILFEIQSTDAAFYTPMWGFFGIYIIMKWSMDAFPLDMTGVMVGWLFWVMYGSILQGAITRNASILIVTYGHYVHQVIGVILPIVATYIPDSTIYRFVILLGIILLFFPHGESSLTNLPIWVAMMRFGMYWILYVLAAVGEMRRHGSLVYSSEVRLAQSIWILFAFKWSVLFAFPIGVILLMHGSVKQPDCKAVSAAEASQPSAMERGAAHEHKTPDPPQKAVEQKNYPQSYVAYPTPPSAMYQAPPAHIPVHPPQPPARAPSALQNAWKQANYTPYGMPDGDYSYQTTTSAPMWGEQPGASSMFGGLQQNTGNFGGDTSPAAVEKTSNEDPGSGQAFRELPATPRVQPANAAPARQSTPARADSRDEKPKWPDGIHDNTALSPAAVWMDSRPETAVHAAPAGARNDEYHGRKLESAPGDAAGGTVGFVPDTAKKTPVTRTVVELDI